MIGWRDEMADNTEVMSQLKTQTDLLRGLEAEVQEAIKRAETKMQLLMDGVPKEDERIVPPKK
jgi:hypothetical protein